MTKILYKELSYKIKGLCFRVHIKPKRVINSNFNSGHSDKDTDNSDRDAGFTLIEVLIYIAIIGAVVGSFVMFSLAISSSRNKTYVAQEVQANARTAQELISQRIRAATGVNVVASTFGLDPGVLSLAMADPTKNPTVINLDQNDGVLLITEGAASPVAITSDEVNVTNLVFGDLTSSGARANIRIEITVAFNNSPGDVEFDYSQSWQTAVSLRQ